MAKRERFFGPENQPKMEDPDVPTSDTDDSDSSEEGRVETDDRGITKTADTPRGNLMWRD